MRNFRIIVVALPSLVSALSLWAAPFSFESASSNVQSYVVDCLANHIRGASIALMHERIDETSRPEDGLMPWYFCGELGLKERRCVEMLKGDPSVAGYKVCYLYQTPREANLLPRLWDASGIGCGYFVGGGPGVGRFVPLAGKDRWRFMPPYDPYLSCRDEFVQLMLLTPEKYLDAAYVKPRKHAQGTNTIAHVLGQSPVGMDSDTLMRKLNVVQVFSNRVFRKHEGCAFQVDYPVPDMDWRSLGTKAEHSDRLKDIQAGNSILMHFNSDEVSEITSLAYAADGRSEEYAAACRRCPKILKPVGTLRTKIGIMLRRAMSEDGHPGSEI